MKNVLVFFGGKSVEHDISVITGITTLKSIDSEKYNAIPVYIDKDGSWLYGEILKELDNYKNLDYKKLTKCLIKSGDNCLYLIKNNKLKKFASIYIAINCLHGLRGEDGSLSGILSLSNIPLASPDMLTSSVFMDKGATKIMLNGIGVNCLPFLVLDGVKNIEEKIKNLSFPLIVKPCNLGSSIGIKTAKNVSELILAVNYGLRFDKRVIVEEKLSDFIEINCAAYRNKQNEIVVSECEKPFSKDDILSFDDKYFSGKREFPAVIDKTFSDQIKQTTKKIYSAFNTSGIIRIDFFIHNGRVLVNEVNTVPGSLAYYLFCNTMQEFSSLLTEIIELESSEFSKSLSLITDFNTKVFSGKGSKGSKTLVK